MTRRGVTIPGFSVRAAVLLALLFLSSGPAVAGPPQKGVEVGTAAPSFSGVTTAGESVNSKDLLSKNRAVLIAFWGIRCAACIEEVPALRKIQEEFPEGTLRVVGVNTDGVDAPALKEMMDEEKISMNYIVLTDPGFKVVDAFKMTAAPLTILIDREGKVRYVHQDYKPGDEIELRGKILETVK